MTRAALLGVLAACSFRGSTAAIDGAPEPDAASDAAADASPDAAEVAFCDPRDPDLIVCYALEDSGADGSAHHLDAALDNVTFAPGKVGEAMAFQADSAAEVVDDPAFDVDAVTIEAWIRPSALPDNGDKADVIDVNRQYSVFVRADGAVTCTLVGLDGLGDAPAGSVKAATWTHVACTYDGARGTIYIDGVAVATQAGGKALHRDGTTGLSIAADNPAGSGSPLIGLIDQVRLFRGARAAAAICRDAGRASCP